MPLKEYFTTGAGKKIRSIASQPLLLPSSQAQFSPIAVLNLHSDHENILQDSGQTLFIPLIEPFCVILATRLEKRAEYACFHAASCAALFNHTDIERTPRMSNQIESQLFKLLLGDRESLGAAIKEASARIASIGQRNSLKGFRSVKMHGASVTHLYDYEAPERVTPKTETSKR